MKKKILKPGSYVDYASLRNEDLVPAFVALLEDLDDEIWVEKLLAHVGRMVVIYSDSSIWDSEVSTEVCVELMDRLDEFVPAGYYFGAHPSNGSDFGVWPCEDEFDFRI